MVDREEVFNYLNLLRESGVTNMFGAGQYIEDEFGISREEARSFLVDWMKNFSGESKAKEFNVGPNLICPVCYKEIDAGNDHLDYDNKTVSWAGRDTYPQFYKLEQHIEQEHTPSEFGVPSLSDYNKGWIGNNLFDATSDSVGGGILDDVTLYNVDSTGTAGVGTYNSQGHGRLDDNQGHYKCPNCRSSDLYNRSGRNYGEDVYCASCSWQGTIRDVVVESIAKEFKPELQGKTVSVIGGDYEGKKGTVISVGIFDDDITVNIDGEDVTVKDGDYSVAKEHFVKIQRAGESISFDKQIKESMSDVMSQIGTTKCPDCGEQFDSITATHNHYQEAHESKAKEMGIYQDLYDLANYAWKIADQNERDGWVDRSHGTYVGSDLAKFERDLEGVDRLNTVDMPSLIDAIVDDQDYDEIIEDYGYESKANESGLYGYGSATGRMSPAEAWNQMYLGGDVYSGARKVDMSVFREFQDLKWTELPSDIQELWKSAGDYMPSVTGEAFGCFDCEWEGQSGDKHEEETQHSTYDMNPYMDFEIKARENWREVANDLIKEQKNKPKKKKKGGEVKASESVLEKVYLDGWEFSVIDDGYGGPYGGGTKDMGLLEVGIFAPKIDPVSGATISKIKGWMTPEDVEDLKRTFEVDPVMAFRRIGGEWEEEWQKGGESKNKKKGGESQWHWDRWLKNGWFDRMQDLIQATGLPINMYSKWNELSPEEQEALMIQFVAHHDPAELNYGNLELDDKWEDSWAGRVTLMENISKANEGDGSPRVGQEIDVEYDGEYPHTAVITKVVDQGDRSNVVFGIGDGAKVIVTITDYLQDIENKTAYYNQGGMRWNASY